MPALRFASFVLCLVVARAALADSGAPRAASESTAAFPDSAPAGDAPAKQEPERPATVPAPPTSTTTAYTDSQSAQPYPVPTYVGTPRDKTRERSVWYGWQTLAVDGISIGLFLAAASGDLPTLEGIAAVGYAAGPPVVHFAHGRVAAGFGSLGLRVALPFFGAAIGASTVNCSGSEDMFCGLDQAAIGVLVGMTLAVGIDAAVLARETVTEKGPAPVRTLRLVPVVDPHRRVAELDVTGVF